MPSFPQDRCCQGSASAGICVHAAHCCLFLCRPTHALKHQQHGKFLHCTLGLGQLPCDSAMPAPMTTHDAAPLWSALAMLISNGIASMHAYLLSMVLRVYMPISYQWYCEFTFLSLVSVPDPTQRRCDTQHQPILYKDNLAINERRPAVYRLRGEISGCPLSRHVVKCMQPKWSEHLQRMCVTCAMHTPPAPGTLSP